MFNRCNKNYFGYCNGQADWEVEPTLVKSGNAELLSGGKCKLGPKTCGRYSSYPVEQKEQEIKTDD